MPRRRVVTLSCVMCAASLCAAQSPSIISEADYADRLRGMWLGEAIANWTGLRTEGRHRDPPFLTDPDWGLPYNGFTLDFTWYFSPWPADDDTDIEYVYLHESARLGRWEFTPEEIRAAWISHISREIWVSNRSARDLMAREVFPPATGMGMANRNRLMIDAQLTTELFGAAYPGMPERALVAADLPIRTTAAGYAAHAAQFYVVLYALAARVDPALSGREKVLWLVNRAREYLPDTSKSADVVDFVLADYLANPDVNNWELTRDRIYDRYNIHAGANGFVYQDWFESSINLATGVMALLYGEGDYRRTVQVGTMSGWDSDNGTATMGGLLGLMGGRALVQSAFPGSNLSDLFDIDSRRDNLPDYVPTHAGAEDTLTMMAERMLPTVRTNIESAGGVVRNGRWVLPPIVGGVLSARNPLDRLDARSANNRVRRTGGAAIASCSVTGAPITGRGVASAGAFANGVELDFRGMEEQDANRWYFSSEGGSAPGDVVLTVTYDRAVEAAAVRVVEGDHFAEGGWMIAPTVECRINGQWAQPPGAWSRAWESAAPFQIIDWELAAPTMIDAVRVRATPGGASRFVTCAEIDVLSAPVAPVWPSFDVNGDGAVGIDDLYTFEQTPRDMNADGVVDAQDRAVFLGAMRADDIRDN